MKTKRTCHGSLLEVVRSRSVPELWTSETAVLLDSSRGAMVSGSC